MQAGQKMSELKFKLVDEATGEDLQLPVDRVIWDGSRVRATSWKPSRFIGNEGYVYDANGWPLAPSVIGAKIVEISQEAGADE